MNPKILHFLFVGFIFSGCSAPSLDESNRPPLSQNTEWTNYTNEELRLIEFINEIGAQSTRPILSVTKLRPDLIEVTTGIYDSPLSSIYTHYRIKKKASGELVLADILTSQS